MKKNVGISYKAFAVILAAVLILGGTIGGTMAWLIDGTTAMKNTFTDSDVDIELTESENLNLQMIPGHTITKDPKVTSNSYKLVPNHIYDKAPVIHVTKGSEACYVFVKINKSSNYDDYLAPYTVADDWTLVDGENNVYYKAFTEKITANTELPVLKDNKVTVLESVTKKQMNDIKNNAVDEPTLTFTAYAVQYYKTNNTPFTVAEAWAKATN